MRPVLLLPFALATLALLPAAAPQTGMGAGLYRQRCQSCHAIAPGTASPLGPNLLGVVGRKAGSTGYSYSPALKAAGFKDAVHVQGGVLAWVKTVDSSLPSY